MLQLCQLTKQQTRKQHRHRAEDNYVRSLLLIDQLTYRDFKSVWKCHSPRIRESRFILIRRAYAYCEFLVHIVQLCVRHIHATTHTHTPTTHFLGLDDTPSSHCRVQIATINNVIIITIIMIIIVTMITMIK